MPSVKRHVLKLVEDNFVKPKKFKKFYLYFANRENKNFKLAKTFFNIKLLYNSGVIDCINKKLSFPTIVLFGSYSKGEDVESSDIDLFIESPKRDIDLSRFEKKIGKKFQLFITKKIRELRNKHLINSIIME